MRGLLRFNLLFSFILFITFSCKIDQNKEVDRSKFTFKTGDDTELFFKNVRQLYYEVEEFPNAKLNIYRLRARSLDQSRPVLNLAIAMNWLKDEAYILPEPNDYLREMDPIIIYWASTTNTDKGKIILKYSTKEANLEFAADIFDGIRNNYTFQLERNKSKIDFLTTQRDREAIRITISDYFRLTRVF